MDWTKLRDRPGYWQLFRKRAEIIDKIREFFKNEGFLEVQTPLLSAALIPESYLEVFATELIDKMEQKQPVYLTPSPELWHKKILAAGASRIFEITKAFRNTDLGGSLHNPEFTILEWYRTGVNYRTTMADCENLIRYLVQPSIKINYQKNFHFRIDLPFERLSVIEAFQRYAGINEQAFFDKEKFIDLAKAKDYQINQNDDWSTIFNLIYVKEIEPNLGQKRPTIIYDYPAQFAPLAKVSQADPRLKERFELYLFGVEIADAYSELTDPDEQKKQFQQEQANRLKLGRVTHPQDEDFLRALQSGLPACSGVALGIDRLIMILTDQADINNVILFSAADIFKQK